ncbi:uncharacterized protein LOC113763531 isoform X2 [Coffea eugenioides]|uniref:uncharacterized protein LOC113763531 isoform X2 n=1 Tax=Coffea eugenioides TaxID=49369 RepID=UPI000F5D4D3A|nr:uncharacterized protein LOC113728462 isoform X2 [Coffea arabica]XP_027163165.1 uncharacterized protein LOC113763531 isoform X2 [Coffea eugenioides]
MASLPSFFFLSRSTSFSFFILFLFFPMHARKSNARSFRVITNAASLKEFLDCKVKEIELRKDSFEQEANAIGRQHSMPSGRIPDRFDPIFGSKAVKEKDEDPRWKSGRKVVESSCRMNFLEATKTECLCRFQEGQQLSKT